MWGKNICWLHLYVPQPGTKPSTHVGDLTRNRTNSLLLCRTVHNHLSHTGEDSYQIVLAILVPLLSHINFRKSLLCLQFFWEFSENIFLNYMLMLKELTSLLWWVSQFNKIVCLSIYLDSFLLPAFHSF